MELIIFIIFIYFILKKNKTNQNNDKTNQPNNNNPMPTNNAQKVGIANAKNSKYNDNMTMYATKNTANINSDKRKLVDYQNYLENFKYTDLRYIASLIDIPASEVVKDIKKYQQMGFFKTVTFDLKNYRIVYNISDNDNYTNNNTNTSNNADTNTNMYNNNVDRNSDNTNQSPMSQNAYNSSKTSSDNSVRHNETVTRTQATTNNRTVNNTTANNTSTKANKTTKTNSNTHNRSNANQPARKSKGNDYNYEYVNKESKTYNADLEFKKKQLALDLEEEERFAKDSVEEEAINLDINFGTFSSFDFNSFDYLPDFNSLDFLSDVDNSII